MRRVLTCLLVLTRATPALAAPNVTNATQKGSALVFPDIRVDREGADWDTLIRIQNDGTLDVTLTWYWMDGNTAPSNAIRSTPSAASSSDRMTLDRAPRCAS
jgi:hypothetical protein